MPFTPAHAAAVLPFLRFRQLSATALVAGSFCPDFEYFFKMSVDGVHGHTIPGLFYFDLPVTIALCFIFQHIVKNALVRNLPEELQSSIPRSKEGSFGRHIKAFPLGFLFSCLLGASTHIVWDSFTHQDGFFVTRLDLYDGAHIRFENVNYPLWYALQHISTFAGLAAVTGYVVMKPEVRDTTSSSDGGYWFAVTFIGIATLTLRFTLQPGAINLGNFVVTAITGICLGLIGGGLIYRRKK